MANNGEDVSYVPRLQTSKDIVDLCGMRVEEAAHQLDMVISGTDSQSVFFVIHGMGNGEVKERALELWGVVFAFWENTSREGIGLKLCMIFGSRLLAAGRAASADAKHVFQPPRHSVVIGSRSPPGPHS
ncbi:hypothetical protein LWI29_033075 [Acer saccharum]|uniref:Smr domain-containing protein n=1 Tax=Acer saccharum TaxID=4024 RepID=A0AA39VPP1_ACESA|nr:hypothetical protein LWI29_033075 [Acer saccharum]